MQVKDKSAGFPMTFRFTAFAPEACHWIETRKQGRIEEVIDKMVDLVVSEGVKVMDTGIS